MIIQFSYPYPISSTIVNFKNHILSLSLSLFNSKWCIAHYAAAVVDG